jgi:hypothetical protein
MTRRYIHGSNAIRIKLPKDFSGDSAARQRERRKIVRAEVIKHYSGKCACCGEENVEFLCIDHIKGGGTQERKDHNRRGHAFYEHLRRQNYPEGYRVLCHNCNFAMGIYGYCPHCKESTRNGLTKHSQH